MQRLLRIPAIILWTLGSLWAWLFFLTLALTKVVGMKVSPPVARWTPSWVDHVVLYGLYGAGTLLITTYVLIQGVRGKLPGTAKANRELPRGFPVDPVQPNE